MTDQKFKLSHQVDQKSVQYVHTFTQEVINLKREVIQKLCQNFPHSVKIPL